MTKYSFLGYNLDLFIQVRDAGNLDWYRINRDNVTPVDKLLLNFTGMPFNACMQIETNEIVGFYCHCHKEYKAFLQLSWDAVSI